MDAIAQALQNKDWKYGGADTAALDQMRMRIDKTGRRKTLMTYKELVDGVLFRIPNVSGGAPFHIDLAEGRNLDREILGSFLGRLCAESYPARGFMASALVVSEATSQPGAGFGRLMREIGAVRSTRKTAVEEFWIEQVKRAHDWYDKHPHD